MFSLLFSVLIQSAVAIPDDGTDMECPAPYAMFVSPSVNQVDVPVNVQPAVFMSNDDCAGPSYYELVLSTGDMVVKSARLDWKPEQSRLLELDLEEDLEPSTVYRLSLIAGDGWGEMTEIQFTTGSEAVVGLGGAPKMELTGAQRESSWVGIDYILSPAADEDALSIVMVFDQDNPDQVLAAHRVEDANDVVFSTWLNDDTGRSDACLFAVQRDGAGHLSDRSESACSPITNQPVDPETPKSCSVISVGGFAWFTPVIALAAIRRRRVGRA